jgi:hypothetical protein
MFVALGIQQAMRMRHIAICCLSGSTICSSRYRINGMAFGKKEVTEHNVCLDFSTTFALNISLSEKK